MHQHGRAAVPRLGEAENAGDVVAGGHDAALDGRSNVVHAEPQMALARDAGGRGHGGLRVEQRHDVRRPVAPDGVLDGGKGRDQDRGHGGKEAARNANGKRKVFAAGMLALRLT